MISIDQARCDQCGKCVEGCPVGAIELGALILIKKGICTDCGICVEVCETGALARIPTKMEFGTRADRHESLTVGVLRRLRRNHGAVFGAAMVVLLILCALFAPWIAPYDPIKISPEESLQAPSWNHPAGTDELGRDMLSRIIYGSKISLRVGMISVLIAGFVGGLLGLYGGYYGGWVDRGVMALVNVMLAFPGILLALSIMALLGPGLNNVMIAVGISGIPRYARLVRGSVLSEKENTYVDAARIVGCSSFRILSRHILPNVFAPVIVLSTLEVGAAILVGASVSYLGLGVTRPTPEWGMMVSDARQYMRIAWWMATLPGLSILVVTLGLNLLGDGLRDALDPRLKI